MDIKKIVKVSFSLIIVIIVLITAINYVVLYQLKINDLSKRQISKLVLHQENMNFLIKDLIDTTTVKMIDKTKKSFVRYEKGFEKTKNSFENNENNIFLEKIIVDIRANSFVQQKLQTLYKNEKQIESAFDKAYVLQEKKIELIDKFNLKYPVENKHRKDLEKQVLKLKNLKLVHTFGKLEYHSKETLYQKKDEITLGKWLKNIDEVKKEKSLHGVGEYEKIAKEMATYAIEIKQTEHKIGILEEKIINIIKLNRKLNEDIQNKIKAISFKFINSVYFYALILMIFSTLFVLIVSYIVNKNVGFSVNEIQEKIQEGLKEIKALNEEIAITQKEVVFTMGAIGEQRSKETGNHVKRVAEYSKLLALRYGLSEGEAEMLKEASPMHDIGKVAIPDTVLNKPGKFNDEERKIMDTHANLGYEMLKGSQRPLLKTAAIVAKEHHEKWNGTGYPDQKKGEDIHIFGRITAIADVFDALGSERVYKKAWDDERIFQLFKDERGKHFDPKLVDIFFDNLKEFLAIRERLQDKF